MGRTPTVREKEGFWFSEAGGKARRFGKVADVSRAEATSRLWQALAEDESPEPQAKRLDSPPLATIGLSNQEPTITFRSLADAYLAWIEAHRSEALHREARRHLGRWCEAFGTRPVSDVRGEDLEAFREGLLDEGHARIYVQKHATTVKAMVNRGIKLRLLPRGFKPFEGIEGLRIEPKALLESDLPTHDEVQRLFAHAKPEFGAILRVYYHTGARTHELIEARVGDYQPKARSLVLSRHKRSHTLRDYRPRTILLNDEAANIIQSRCRGQEHDDIIFPNRNGNPFTSCLLGDMFARLRTRTNVRSHVTIYSLRHLWVSECLMAGMDALMVARMAGTSVKMVEQVYGHFRTQTLKQALHILDRSRLATTNPESQPLTCS